MSKKYKEILRVELNLNDGKGFTRIGGYHEADFGRDLGSFEPLYIQLWRIAWRSLNCYNVVGDEKVRVCFLSSESEEYKKQAEFAEVLLHCTRRIYRNESLPMYSKGIYSNGLEHIFANNFKIKVAQGEWRGWSWYNAHF